MANAEDHQLLLIKGNGHASLQHMGVRDRSAVIGEPLTVACLSHGATPHPNLTLHMNDQDLQQVRGARIEKYGPVRMTSRGSRMRTERIGLIGYVDNIHDGLFPYSRNTLSFVCKAWYGDQKLAEERLTLTKKERNMGWNAGGRPRYRGGSPQQNLIAEDYQQQPRKSRGKLFANIKVSNKSPTIYQLCKE